MTVKFNGMTQGINIPSSAICQNITACTLMAWVNITQQYSGGAVGAGIIQIGVNSGGLSRINLLIPSSRVVHIGGRCPDSGTYQSIISTTSLSINTWYHIVGMLDFANNVGYIYINGELSTVTGTIAFTNTSTDNTQSLSTNIGSNELNNGEWFNGSMDDARVYHRLLSGSEVQTIYTCRGCDSILYGLECRWLMEGYQGQQIGSYSDITVNNALSAQTTGNASSITMAYTAPIGSNLVLVVVATAEDGNTGRVQPTGITFNGNALSSVATTRTTTSPYDGISIFSKAVTSGESGNIVVTYSGNNDGRTVSAITLIGVSSATSEATATSFSNTGATTTGLTTITDKAIVITGGINKNNSTLTAVGTNHSIDSGITAGTVEGAIGHVTTTIAGAISGIGFSATTMTGSAIVLAAFTPYNQTDEISVNEYKATVYNVPTYEETFLKFRRF